MEPIFISLISILTINQCLARRSYSSRGGGGSASLSTEAIIGISVGVGVPLIILTIILVICTVKQVKRQKIANLPLSARIDLAQGGNQYAPPGYNQGPPSNQPPSYNQKPPYVQRNPPPYSAFNTQRAQTTMPMVSWATFDMNHRWTKSIMEVWSYIKLNWNMHCTYINSKMISNRFFSLLE